MNNLMFLFSYVFKGLCPSEVAYPATKCQAWPYISDYVLPELVSFTDVLADTEAIHWQTLPEPAVLAVWAEKSCSGKAGFSNLQAVPLL